MSCLLRNDLRIDPDMVVGYDTRRYSWGYLVERSIALGRNLLSALSRYPIGESLFEMFLNFWNRNE